MWLNLVAMCAFLAHAASGVVFAILDVFKVYNKVAQANGEEEAFGKASVAGKDDAWIEGSGVPDAFQPSRRMEHWRHGHGFAIAVDFEKERPYLVCFASGSAKRCALPDLLRAIAWGRKWSWFVAGGLRRYTANKLTRKFTIQTSPTRAWAIPSVDTLPQVLKGAHLFHCWLGCAQVIEIHEVRGWLGQLTNRMSRIHVRRIPAAARNGCV